MSVNCRASTFPWVGLLTLLFSLLASAAAEELFRGRLSQVWEEKPDQGLSRHYLVLERPGASNLRLNFENSEHLNALVGRTVQLEGQLLANGILHHPRILQIEPVEQATSSPAWRTSESASALTLLVGVFEIPGATISSAVTAEAIQQQLIGHPTRSLKVLFETNSYGALSVQAVTVATRATLPIAAPPSDGNCYPWYAGSLGPAALSAFNAQGIDPSNFDRVLLIVPTSVGDACGFAGLAISATETLYSGGISASLAAHELGHNMGMGHASSDTNNDGIFDNAYGDPSCIMGLFGGHYNLLHTQKQNWFTAAGGSIPSYAASGTQTISMTPAEVAPMNATSPQFVQLSPPVGGRPYYISFRKNVGTLDAFYDLDAFSNNKLYILRPPGTLTLNTLLVAEILPGESFSSESDQVLIEYVSETNNQAQVRFSLGPVDSDADGQLNSSDTDDDNDGVPDAQDCAPTNNSRWTRRAYLDPDNDGYPTNSTLYDIIPCVGNAPNTGYTLTASPLDNCYQVYNPDQRNTDGDNLGDACDSISGPNPGPSTTPGAGGESLSSIYLSDSKRTKKGYKLLFIAYGGSSEPAVSCAVRNPRSSSFSTARPAKLISTSGTARVFRCNSPVSGVGKFSIKAKACIGSTCVETLVKGKR